MNSHTCWKSNSPKYLCKFVIHCWGCRKTISQTGSSLKTRGPATRLEVSSNLVRAKIVKGLGSGRVRRPGGFNPENTGCGVDKIAALNYQRGCPVNPVESTPPVCYSQEELELRGGDPGDWTLVPKKDDLSKSESARKREPPTMRDEASEEGLGAPGDCWAREPLRFFPSPRGSE